MKQVTRTQLAALSGVSTLDIQNWMMRLPLSTKYANTTSGVARQFSRDNALEILLMSRLIKNGMAPAAAAERLAKLFKELKQKKPHGWALFINDERFPVDFMVSDEPPSAKLLAKLSGCVVVNVAQLADHVDAFFEREASDDQ
jgi:hypothetical protein